MPACDPKIHEDVPPVLFVLETMSSPELKKEMLMKNVSYGSFYD